MNNIYIVTSTVSDIGKGWVSSCLTKIFDCKSIIKIDPALVTFNDCINDIDVCNLSSDYVSYTKLNPNISITRENIIRGGDILKEFIDKHTVTSSSFDAGTATRTSFIDVSYFVADKLSVLLGP
jgi:hypothetical protein